MMNYRYQYFLFHIFLQEMKRENRSDQINQIVSQKLVESGTTNYLAAKYFSNITFIARKNKKLPIISDNKSESYQIANEIVLRYLQRYKLKLASNTYRYESNFSFTHPHLPFSRLKLTSTQNPLKDFLRVMKKSPRLKFHDTQVIQALFSKIPNRLDSDTKLYFIKILKKAGGDDFDESTILRSINTHPNPQIDKSENVKAKDNPIQSKRKNATNRTASPQKKRKEISTSKSTNSINNTRKLTDNEDAQFGQLELPHSPKNDSKKRQKSAISTKLTLSPTSTSKRSPKSGNSPLHLEPTSSVEIYNTKDPNLQDLNVQITYGEEDNTYSFKIVENNITLSPVNQKTNSMLNHSESAYDYVYEYETISDDDPILNQPNKSNLTQNRNVELNKPNNYKADIKKKSYHNPSSPTYQTHQIPQKEASPHFYKLSLPTDDDKQKSKTSKRKDSSSSESGDNKIDELRKRLYTAVHNNQKQNETKQPTSKIAFDHSLLEQKSTARPIRHHHQSKPSKEDNSKQNKNINEPQKTSEDVVHRLSLPLKSIEAEKPEPANQHKNKEESKSKNRKVKPPPPLNISDDDDDFISDSPPLVMKQILESKKKGVNTIDDSMSSSMLSPISSSSFSELSKENIKLNHSPKKKDEIKKQTKEAENQKRVQNSPVTSLHKHSSQLQNTSNSRQQSTSNQISQSQTNNSKINQPKNSSTIQNNSKVTQSKSTNSKLNQSNNSRISQINNSKNNSKVSQSNNSNISQNNISKVSQSSNSKNNTSKINQSSNFISKTNTATRASSLYRPNTSLASSASKSSADKSSSNSNSKEQVARKEAKEDSYLKRRSSVRNDSLQTEQKKFGMSLVRNQPESDNPSRSSSSSSSRRIPLKTTLSLRSSGLNDISDHDSSSSISERRKFSSLKVEIPFHDGHEQAFTKYYDFLSSSENFGLDNESGRIKKKIKEKLLKRSSSVNPAASRTNKLNTSSNNNNRAMYTKDATNILRSGNEKKNQPRIELKKNLIMSTSSSATLTNTPSPSPPARTSKVEIQTVSNNNKPKEVDRSRSVSITTNPKETTLDNNSINKRSSIANRANSENPIKAKTETNSNNDSYSVHITVVESDKLSRVDTFFVLYLGDGKQAKRTKTAKGKTSGKYFQESFDFEITKDCHTLVLQAKKEDLINGDTPISTARLGLMSLPLDARQDKWIPLSPMGRARLIMERANYKAKNNDDLPSSSSYSYSYSINSTNNRRTLDPTTNNGIYSLANIIKDNSHNDNLKVLKKFSDERKHEDPMLLNLVKSMSESKNFDAEESFLSVPLLSESSSSDSNSGDNKPVITSSKKTASPKKKVKPPPSKKKQTKSKAKKSKK